MSPPAQSPVVVLFLDIPLPSRDLPVRRIRSTVAYQIQFILIESRVTLTLILSVSFSQWLLELWPVFQCYFMLAKLPWGNLATSSILIQLTNHLLISLAIRGLAVCCPAHSFRYTKLRETLLPSKRFYRHFGNFMNGLL